MPPAFLPVQEVFGSTVPRSPERSGWNPGAQRPDRSLRIAHRAARRDPPATTEDWPGPDGGMLSAEPGDWRAAPARRGRLSPPDPCCKPDSPGPAPLSAILDSLSHFHFRAAVGASHPYKPKATKFVRGVRFTKEAKNSVTQVLQTCIKRSVRAPK